MQKLNLTVTQRVAIWWLKNVDNSFILLRNFSFPVRLLVYSALIGFTIFGMIFISFFVGYFFTYEDVPGLADWQLLGDIIFYGVIVGMILILTLESVYKLDVAKLIADIKLQKQEIKAQKLQKWRLRNMNIFLRIFIYISLYMYMLFIILTSANGYYDDTFGMVPNTAERQKQIAFFINEYDTFVKWFTFLYLISGLTLDFFVIKNRAKRRMEAQNESV